MGNIPATITLTLDEYVHLTKEIDRLKAEFAAYRNSNYAANGELVAACKLFVKHHDGYNLDGSFRGIAEDNVCARNWQKVYEIAKAALKEAV